MKHICAVSVLAMACCSFSAAAEDGIEELCREVLNSIASDDPVAYAQCYSTNRHRKRQMSKLGPPLSADDTQRLLGKFRQRNTTIRHSFRIMREQIPDPKAKIQFVSADANVKTETFKGLTITATMMRSGCCIWMTGSCRMVSGSYPMILYPWKHLPKRSSSDRRAETRMVD